MFEFEELEAVLPAEAHILYGAGLAEANGLYLNIHVEAFGAPIYRHSVSPDFLLSREQHNGKHGWLVGCNRQPLYGAKTEAVKCPVSASLPAGEADTAAAASAGAASAATTAASAAGEEEAEVEKFRSVRKSLGTPPSVEGFPTVAEAARRLAEVWCLEGDALADAGDFKAAANRYKKVLGLPDLPAKRKAEVLSFRAKAHRLMAESKKAPKEGSIGDAALEDPLSGLAAEWAIEDAEEALKLDASCFLAAWEGAIAAKSIAWWSKGRHLAKQAMQAVPAGPKHRAQRETASTLFILLAEEEEGEKNRKVKEMQAAKEKRPEIVVDPKELEWARDIATQLNEVLKLEDFRRPHHQLWKLVGPGLHKKDAEEVFSEIRNLVWEKWNSIAWLHGYRTSWDVKARQKMCSRLVNVANTGKADDVKKLIKEMEDRICLDWPEIAEAADKIEHDETWAWTRHADGTWGAWGRTTLR